MLEKHHTPHTKEAHERYLIFKRVGWNPRQAEGLLP
jgi:hypothetical protein